MRIIRAARELGIGTIQVHSEADADSLAVRLADEAVDIGPPPATKSYLNIDSTIAAAKQTGACAVHPGYGFLAESAAFAEAVTDAGMKFVGPSAEAIRLLGDKVAARNAAIAAGVPVVPGSDGRVASFEDAEALARQTGFPVMIKAAAGGGGRGIRIINSAEEFAHQFPQASAEASAAFGDGGLYLEKVIDQARHIEVQVLGDGQRVLHCFERECSLQRRRQKIWEEAPSAVLPERVRKSICAAAVSLAKSVQYQGAGTLELLYDEASEYFYFIEMNTRIQVEHPVTEMITGIDLVREMISIASGKPISIEQDDIRYVPTRLLEPGHAVSRRFDQKTALIQMAGEKVGNRPIIINHEYPAELFAPFALFRVTGKSPFGGVYPSPLARLRGWDLGYSGGQLDGKSGALVGFALNLDIAAHHAAKMPRDRQPETGTAVLPGGR